MANPLRTIPVNEDAASFGIVEEPGYLGAFTRKEHTGAIPNGTRVKKVWGEDGDTHPVGSEGVVLGSIGAGSMIGYFIEWDARPKAAVFVAGPKLEAIDG
jgi:hypothetical protein